ncbi:MAG: DUF4340 domain-containing protein [Pseudomonadota bacterium]
MKLSKVLIYLIILVALATYVYFVEIRHKEKLEAQKAEAEKIVKLDKDKVTQIELKSKKGGVIGLKKTEGTWVIITPVAVKADPSAVKALLNAVSEAQCEKVLKEKDVRWDEYDLDKPAFTVSVNTKDDSYALFFGASNPAKTSFYLRTKGGSRLLLVADTLKNALDKSTFDLRDKTVFALAPDDIDRVLIAKEGTETELKKEAGDKWVMLRPERMRVKAEDVKRDLIGLTNLQAREIIDEPKKDGDPYGLDSPKERIELAGTKRSQTLLVGKAKGDKEKQTGSHPDLFARIKGMDMVYLIDGRTLGSMKTDPKELRDKCLLDFKPDRIDKLEVALDGKKWSAVRSSKDAKWTLEEPEKRKDMDAWAITGLLWGLKNLEWKDVTKPAPSDLPAVNLDAPRLVVSLWRKDDKEPMVLKAGWKDKPAEKVETGAKDESGSEPKSGSKPAGAEDKAEAEAAAAGKTGKQAKEPSKLPGQVSVMVQPHDEKNALFTIEGTYIERIREDLQRLTEEEKK